MTVIEGTCESCRFRSATRVVHFEACDGFEPATFLVCELCAPVEFTLTDLALSALS